ncbi:MAG: ParA family protein [Gammaproteobacteria bacterium]|nr:ParA family protein [Gammaproteobacteria bacterium]
MHKIMVLNAKGGCGKTTIATTLACFFAGQGYSTALMDFDPQHSSYQWLKIRSPEEPPIKAIDGVRTATGVTRSWQLYSGAETDVVIIDTPAGITGGKLTDLFHKADTILVPVMPSIIDLLAMRGFLDELGRLRNRGHQKKRVGIIANRVTAGNQSKDAIKRLSDGADLPLIAVLRDTQNYSTAMASGLGISELNPGMTTMDREHWGPILDWLKQEIPGTPGKPASSSRARWPFAVA